MGRTPLDEAARAGHAEVLGRMLKALPPGAAREAELRKLSLFAAEPGAALHPDDLRQLGLPATPRRSPLRRAQPAARAEPAARSRAE